METTNNIPAPPRNGGTLKLILAAVGLIIIGLALVSARGNRRTAAPTATLVFADESLSITRRLDGGRTVQQLGLDFVDQAVDGIFAPRSPLKVWAFADRKAVRSLWEGTPSGAEDLASLQEWAASHPRGGEGTYALPAFRTALAAARTAAARHQDAVIIICSDGEWDDADKIDGLAARIAALPNVRAFVVLPVSVGGTYRTRLDSALVPFGRRAVVAGPTDIEQAEERLRTLLDR